MDVGRSQDAPYRVLRLRTAALLEMLYASNIACRRTPAILKFLMNRRSICSSRSSNMVCGGITFVKVTVVRFPDRSRPSVGGTSALVATKLAVIGMPGRL